MSGAKELAAISKFSSRFLKNWGTSLAIYSAAVAVVGLYITDWKIVATKIPYYGKKFDEEDRSL